MLMAASGALKSGIQSGNLDAVKENLAKMGKLDAAEKAQLLALAQTNVNRNRQLAPDGIDSLQIIGGCGLLSWGISSFLNCYRNLKRVDDLPDELHLDLQNPMGGVLGMNLPIKSWAKDFVKASLILPSLGILAGSLLVANGAYCRGGRTRLKVAKKIESKIAAAQAA